MKARTLLILVVIVAVLAALAYYRNYQNRPVSIVEEAQLQPLLPTDLEPDDIDRIELYAGPKPDEKLVLARTDDPEKWIVESHFNAPAQTSAITEFLDQLTGLEGEHRQTVAGDDGLDTYQIGEDEGFHVIGYKEAAEAPLFHVLVGKAPDFGSAFMRAADTNDIYFVNIDLRREAGIYTRNHEDPPEPDNWLDKEILALNRDEISRVALTYPDKSLTFERREVPQETAAGEEEAEAADGEEADETGEADDAEQPAEPALPEYEWVVASGGFGEPLAENGLNPVLNKLASLRATDVVDPTKLEDWGLASPAYRASVTVNDEAIELDGGHPDVDGSGYIRVTSRDQDIVYEVSKYNFEQLFQKGGQFFEMPGILTDVALLDRIEYTTPEADVVLVRDGEKWSVESPQADVPVAESNLDRLARTAASIKAEDYADSAEGKGLENPTRTLQLISPDVTHTIVAGDKSPHTDGYYARFDDGDTVLVISEPDATRIFAAPSELYDRQVVEFEEIAISSLELWKEDETLSLERDDGTWQIVSGEGPTEADQNAVRDVLIAISTAVADELVFGDAFVQGGIIGYVEFSADEGESYRLNIYANDEESHVVEVVGRNTRYVVNNSTVGRMLPDLNALKVEPPEQPESDATAPAGGEDEGEDAEPAPEPAPASDGTPEN